MAEDERGEQPLRGDRALALGAIAAGVRVVTGYPGSPVTGVFEQIMAAPEAEVHHGQWAPNEKVALELAFGASLAGARALVVLKSVGLNVALDPLATLSLSGTHAGLVILLGDDPGGWGSQNEQDSRWLARVAEVPLVEPISVEGTAALMVQAFAWSESAETPVIVRVTRALTEAQGETGKRSRLPASRRRFSRKRNQWVVLPAGVVQRHESLHRRLREVQLSFEASSHDVSSGRGRLGVIAVGYAHAKLLAVLGQGTEEPRVLGLSSVWPLPEESLTAWLQEMDRVLVLEEGGPFVEQGIRSLIQRKGLSPEVLGRLDRVVPEEGEISRADIGAALVALFPSYQPAEAQVVERAMPSTVPLCDDCSYRTTFEALLDAMERRGGRDHHIVVGETGCMVRANLPPMELFDVKYSLGSSLGMALGLALNDEEHRVIALVGDSAFFHSDINAMPYLAQLNPAMTVVVLDNGVTALTGGQAHPGSSVGEGGEPRIWVDVAEVIRGCGLEPRICWADSVPTLSPIFQGALRSEGLSVVVVRGPCRKYVRGEHQDDGAVSTRG